MVFNVTFNTISGISWQSVLLVEEPECPQKITDLPQVTFFFIKTSSWWQPDNYRSDYFSFLFCFENKSLKNI